LNRGMSMIPQPSLERRRIAFGLGRLPLAVN
jgi:hypothetical protein